MAGRRVLALMAQEALAVVQPELGHRESEVEWADVVLCLQLRPLVIEAGQTNPRFKKVRPPMIRKEVEPGRPPSTLLCSKV